MLVDAVCRFGELIGEQVHQVLHQVALGHQQILTDVNAVPFKLVLIEENVQELLVCFLVGLLNPLFQLVNV